MTSFLLLLLCSLASAAFISSAQFSQNLKGKDLVEYLNLKQNFFKAEESKFTVDEVRARVMKGDFAKRIEEAPVAEESVIEAGSIPASFDSRQHWPNCASIKAIYDQGQCGSCWAFCTAESMSDRTCIAKQQHVVLSPQDILTCCPNCGYGCNGGWPIKALQYWDKTGVCTGGPAGSHGDCKPYTSGNGQSGSCQAQCQAGYSIPYAQDKHRGSTAYVIAQNVATIQKEIMTNGPVTSSFDVYEDFYHYKSGVYVHTGGRKVGGHCVKTIGWGVENGTPYWLVANSWNTNWGEKEEEQMRSTLRPTWRLGKLEAR